MAHSSLKSQQAHGAEIHHRTMISDHSLRSSAKEISIEDVCSLPVGDTETEQSQRAGTNPSVVLWTWRRDKVTKDAGQGKAEDQG